MKPFRGIMRSDPPSPRAAWQEIVDIIQRNGLAKAANLLERSEIIYPAGQLCSVPFVELRQYILTILGKQCVLLHTSGWLETRITHTMGPRDVLVAVSFRFYATEIVNIVGQPRSLTSE